MKYLYLVLNNLKQIFLYEGFMFQKGQSGNPKGRPRGSGISQRTRLLNYFLDKSEEEWPVVLEALFSKARGGNMRAISLIFDFNLPKIPSTHVIDDRTSQEGCEKTKEELLAIINS